LNQFQTAFPANHPARTQVLENAVSHPNPRENPFYQPLFSETLQPQERNNLITLLNRLQNTKDFTNLLARPQMVLRVLQMLGGMCTHQEFREKSMAIITEALLRCGDRVALSFGQIEVQWRFHCDPGAADSTKFANLLIGAERQKLLRAFADRIIKVKDLGDDVEVYLYLEVRLKDALKLPVSTEGMLYPGMAGISDKDLLDAQNYALGETSTQEQVARILASSELWQNRIKQEYRKDFDEVLEACSAKITRTMEDQSLSGKERQSRIDEIEAFQKAETNRLIRDFTNTFVKNTLMGSSSGSNAN
jgi:hypothetical protein